MKAVEKYQLFSTLDGAYVDGVDIRMNQPSLGGDFLYEKFGAPARFDACSTPVRSEGQQNPGRSAQGAAEMHNAGIDADRDVRRGSIA